VLRAADRAELRDFMGGRPRVLPSAGSPGYVGCTKAEGGSRPVYRDRVDAHVGPALLSADFLSKSRLKLVRHCVARSMSTTWLPGKRRFVWAL